MNAIKSWHYNRPSSRKTVLFRWVRNPFGALVRIVEFIALGLPQISVLKSAQQFHEIKHLNPDFKHMKDLDLYLVSENRIDLENNFILMRSGHIFTPRHGSHAFLSGQYLSSFRNLMKSNSEYNHSNVVPIPSQSYYFHFMIEELPSIIKISSLYPKFKFILMTDQPHYVHSILSALNIPFEVVGHRLAQLSDSIVYGYNQVMTLESLQLIRKSIMGDSRSIKPQRRILLLRSGLDREENSQDLIYISKLQSLGFENVLLDDMLVSDQAIIFSQAEFVVGLHGGALTNLVFCQNSVRVFEVFNHEYRNLDFAQICKLLGISYSSGRWGDLENALSEWNLLG